jgi:hypothetical protein
MTFSFFDVSYSVCSILISGFCNDSKATHFFLTLLPAVKSQLAITSLPGKLTSFIVKKERRREKLNDMTLKEQRNLVFNNQRHHLEIYINLFSPDCAICSANHDMTTKEELYQHAMYSLFIEIDHIFGNLLSALAPFFLHFKLYVCVR